MLHYLRISGVVWGLFSLLGVQLVAGQVPQRTIALTGDQAPGLPTGVEFRWTMGHGVINNAGHVAFWSYSSQPGEQQGIWTDRSGLLSAAVLEGNPAPGFASGTVIDSINILSFDLSDAGDLPFQATVNGDEFGPFSVPAIWIARHQGNLALVARRGLPAPGTNPEVMFGAPNSNFYFIGPIVCLNGDFAFRATLDWTGITALTANGIWVGNDSNLSVLAATGTVASGFGDETLFTTIVSSATNPYGQTVFHAGTEDVGGIWVGNAAQLTRVVKWGDPAPGYPAGTTQDLFWRPTINDSGMIAFTGNVKGPGVDTFFDSAIFAGTPGDLQVVVKDGDPAPGALPGAVFRYIDNGYPILNNAGDVAFVAYATQQSLNYGLWIAHPGETPEKIAIRGDPAPGVAGDAFSSLFYSIPSMNSRGQVVFSAGLASTGGNADGIWATDRSGVLKLVTRVGAPIEVRPGDVRIVSEFELVDRSGGGDGKPRCINDRGEVVYTAEFTDGSAGVFVASLGPIGDLNCDGLVNEQDIPAFATAVVSPTTFLQAHPTCNPNDADFNGDGQVNSSDIQGFVAELLGL